MVCRIPGELVEKSCQVLGELAGRIANVADNGSQKKPPLYLFSEVHKFLGVWSRPDKLVYMYISLPEEWIF